MVKRKRTPKRRPRSHKVSRKAVYASMLHRAPRRWDVLMFELALALAERCRRISSGLLERLLRFDGEESLIIGRMLAQGFDLLVSRNWPGEPGDEPVNLWPVNEASAEATARRARRSVVEPLLRKYVQDRDEVCLPRPSHDVQRLTTELGEALREFLLDRCGEGGKLADAVAQPLGSQGGYFSENGMPADPAQSTGDPRRDVYELGLMIRPQDDAGTLKQKLLLASRLDPWISQELFLLAEERLMDEEAVDAYGGLKGAEVQIADDFLFEATHLDGKTPIELVVERQPDMDARQRERLLRWSREAFYGVFQIEAVHGAFLEAVDLQTDRQLRITAANTRALRRAQSHSLLATRVVPWDDYWLASGAATLIPSVGPLEMQRTRRDVKRQPFWRPAGMEAPQVAKARQIQEEMYDAWVKLFGVDEMAFGSGQEAEAALERFERYWTEEIPLPESGLTRAEQARREGKPWTGPLQHLEGELLETDDVGVLLDREHGLEILPGYSRFQSAFEGIGRALAEQVEMVWEYLTDGGISHVAFERMRQRHPQRTEEVLRTVLRDDEFRLDRDFERVLRRFKGEQMRRPPMPGVVVVEREGRTGKQAEGEAGKR